MDWNRTKSELIDAILARDLQRIGEIADRMRRHGKLNYDEQFALARQLTRVSAAEWDELLYEADQEKIANTD